MSISLHPFPYQDSALKYWVSLGATRDKINVGLPTYGRTFTLADSSKIEVGDTTRGPGTAGLYTREAGFLSYYEVGNVYSKHGVCN